MLPIADVSPKNYRPYINYLFIGLALTIFFMQPDADSALYYFFNRYGIVPAKLTAHDVTLSYFSRLITASFLHVDWLHLLGNLFFLYIFGDNIEFVLGHTRYFFFFILVGIAGILAHILMVPSSTIPLVGASGAISGVLGAYLVKFPTNRISLLVFLIIKIRIIKVPAFMVLLLWLALQLYNGFTSMGDSSVAWFAHIGGFFSGLIFIKLFEWYPRYS